MKTIAFITTALCIASSSLTYAANDKVKSVKAAMPELMTLYKDLHQSPELSSYEF